MAIAADQDLVQIKALAVWGLGRVALWQDHNEEAAAAFEEAVALTRGLGVNVLLSGALENLGSAVIALGDFDRAVEVLEEALTLARARPCPTGFVLTNLG